MHWTTHILIGATLGYATGEPFLAELAGIAEHLTLDMLPHNDPQTDFAHLIDTALGIATLSILAGSKSLYNIDPERSLLFGAIGGALPDCELIIKAVDRDFEMERLFFPSHNGLLPHGYTENILLSYSIEAVVLAASTVLALRKYRKLNKKTGSPPPRGLRARTKRFS